MPKPIEDFAVKANDLSQDLNDRLERGEITPDQALREARNFAKQMRLLDESLDN